MSPIDQWLPLAVNIAVLVGLGVAILQLKAANGALKAQVLMKLFDEWRDPKLYRATIYIYRLRESWNAFPVSEWPKLAQKWVEEHAGRDAYSADSGERTLWEEWEMRRTLSQFLAKMDSLIEAGYLTDNEFFGANPEAGRQMAVLTFIEIAIQEHWAGKVREPIAEWDHPFPKFEFNTLWPRYERWYGKHGRGKKLLASPRFANQITARSPKPIDATPQG